MSISTTTRKAGPFTGNGVQVSFPFAFKVFAVDDVLVVRGEIATTVEATLTRGVHYNVTLNTNQDTNPGGTVNWIGTPLSSAYTLVIGSKVASTQPANFTNLGRFYPRVINDALDRLTILVQQLAEEVSRSVKVGFSGLISPDELVNTITTAASTAAGAAADAAAAAGVAGGLVDAAQAAIDAANAASAGALQRSGGTMTGALTLAGNASANLQAVPKQQAESIAAQALADAEGYTDAAQTATEAKLFGVSQSWQAVTRAGGTTYFNTTGRPLGLLLNGVTSGAGVVGIFYVAIDGGANLPIAAAGGAGIPQTVLSGIITIPAGSSYVVTYNNIAGGSVAYELR